MWNVDIQNDPIRLIRNIYFWMGTQEKLATTVAKGLGERLAII